MNIVIFWIFLSGVAAAIAQNKGRSGVGFFFLSIFLSPLIGVLAALVAKADKEHLEKDQLASGSSRKCTYCAELIKKEATVCRYCSKELPPLDPSLQPKPSHTVVYILGGIFFLVGVVPVIVALVMYLIGK